MNKNKHHREYSVPAIGSLYRSALTSKLAFYLLPSATQL